jgi:hypothetical protein
MLKPCIEDGDSGLIAFDELSIKPDVHDVHQKSRIPKQEAQQQLVKICRKCIATAGNHVAGVVYRLERLHHVVIAVIAVIVVISVQMLMRAEPIR